MTSSNKVKSISGLFQVAHFDIRSTLLNHEFQSSKKNICNRRSQKEKKNDAILTKEKILLEKSEKDVAQKKL